MVSKKQFLNNGPVVFSDKSDNREEKLEETQEVLFKKVGQHSMRSIG